MSSISNKVSKVYRGVIKFENQTTGETKYAYTSRVYEQPRYAKGKLTQDINERRNSWGRGFYYDPSNTSMSKNFALVERYVEESEIVWVRS